MNKRSKAKLAAAIAGTVVVIILAAGRDSDGAAFSPAAGKTVPELKLPDLNGNEWRLSTHRGEVVLINFWATWCPPCRYETPSLIDIYRDYRSKGFTAVGISLDEDGPDVVRQFVRKYNIPYPILLPGDSAVGAGIQSLPTTLLIDRKGRAAKVYQGMVYEDQLRRDVERLLAE